ncbi:Conserved hypothetical protein 2001 [hydrothermal vent metagenome]|uniref:Outer membrane protein beta-barrel domain-containing protein n=1 Tax=hydrothermal vent metagenome TaxID=652676 RepID=A0A1W1BXQ6_9ZZZZ
MKFTKLSLVAVLTATTMSSTLVADEVELSANVSATNNYVWRGMTQSANKTAVQGGLDVGYSGLYLGTWVSNVDFGSDATTEIDGYVGYGGEVAGIEYDLGYIQFAYLNEGDANFEEAYLGLSKDFGVASLGATYSIGIDDAPDDIALEAAIGLPQDYSLDLGWGDYDTVGSRYSVGVSKSFDKVDFSLSYHEFTHDTTDSNDEKNIVVSVGTDF